MADKKIVRWMKCNPKDSDFDCWIKNGFNVLLKGKHGVGKTSKIKAAFERNFGSDKNFLLFSAATMDPLMDFIGVPREQIDENGKAYLDFVQRKEIRDGNIEAIFIDEFNRGDKRITNAVMELIQFKSVNGRKLPKLKVVFAAINPYDDEEHNYHTEEMDAAVEDRFHIQIELPYELDTQFFAKKYNEQTASAVSDWWLALPDKNLVSPRRVEYAIDVFMAGGNIRHVLKMDCLPDKLSEYLKNGSFKREFLNLHQDKKWNELGRFLSRHNVISDEEIASLILAHKETTFHLIDEEYQVKFLISHENDKSLSDMVFDSKNKIKFTKLLESLSKSTNTRIRTLAQITLNGTNTSDNLTSIKNEKMKAWNEYRSKKI